MNLNNIDLSPALLASLYPGSLVLPEIEINPEKQIDSKKSVSDQNSGSKAGDTGRKWLGNNEKNILIAVKHPNNVYLPDEELELLKNILGACKLSLGDVAVVNINNENTAGWKELTGYLKSRIVLLFDVEPSGWGLPVSFPAYQLQPFNGITWLYTPPLNLIASDKVEKSKLWVCLKRLFNL
jgi:hypothetical protein